MRNHERMYSITPTERSEQVDKNLKRLCSQKAQNTGVEGMHPVDFKLKSTGCMLSTPASFTCMDTTCGFGHGKQNQLEQIHILTLDRTGRC